MNHDSIAHVADEQRDIREEGDDLSALRLDFVEDLARAHVVKTWVHTTLVERDLAVGLHCMVAVVAVVVAAAAVVEEFGSPLSVLYCETEIMQMIRQSW